MRPRLALGLALATLLCYLGLRKHRNLRRAGPMGGYRCTDCQRAFSDLDDAGEEGSGYVSPLRPVYSRDGAGGHATISREEVG